MKILITGATGFIGSRLATRSLEKGHEVVAYGQTNTEAEKANLARLQAAGVQPILGSVTDRAALERALDGVDVVFHLAAAQHEANVPDRHFHEVNVEGTRNVLEAARDAGVQRYVHGSTIGVYGEAADGVIDEQTPPRPANIYGRTKLEAEGVVREFADRLPVTIVRISETYGPGDRRLLKLFRAIRKRAFFMIGPGQNLHQLIHVDDLVDGMYLAAERESALDGIFNLVGREVLSTQEMVETIADAVGTPLRKFRAPLFPFMAAAVVLEAVCRPLGIQPPLHRRRMDFFVKSFRFDPALARERLGFEPRIDFRTGTRQTAEWYEQQGLL
ncbi:MAG TPA: NAD-dependent epimerase/dehydratase family protein [Thiotrichales bacterium]|nr:NAD-dependent epimerase/dehydratase family protein [Thiotrichales bacterium]